ncbi:MAG: leucine-rich repeat protein [Clostridia bacterium]|nr:leucine-rich repeat protein [Clostridia bacterium]
MSASAFSNCRDLTAITIPDSVAYIYDDAFEFCTRLPLRITVEF